MILHQGTNFNHLECSMEKSPQVTIVQTSPTWKIFEPSFFQIPVWNTHTVVLLWLIGTNGLFPFGHHLKYCQQKCHGTWTSESVLVIITTIIIIVVCYHHHHHQHHNHHPASSLLTHESNHAPFWLHAMQWPKQSCHIPSLTKQREMSSVIET